MALACPELMPILEARFYPRSKAEPSFVIMGRVVLERGLASIEAAQVPSRRVWPFDGDGLQSKLRSIVESAVRDPYPELLGLRSAYWAFVDSPGKQGL